MKLIKYIVLSVFPILFTSSLHGQVKIGGWRDHLSYKHIKSLVEANHKIYGITQAGVLFYYNKKDNSLNKFSTIQGLSEVGVSEASYSKTYNTLVIGYSNGNIDLLHDNEIFNISDIKDKNVLRNKGINNIYILNEKAYLACGFGIVVLDLVKEHIKETYYIGPDGSQIEIFDITFDANTEKIYAATESGVYRADINSPNLIDFRNWHQLNVLPHQDKAFNHITNFQDTIYINYDSPGDTNDQIYKYANQAVDTFDHRHYPNCISLQKYYSQLAIVKKGQADFYTSSSAIKDSINIWKVRNAIVDQEGSYWAGMIFSGLYQKAYDGNWAFHQINSPYRSDVVDISIRHDIVWAAGGGPNNPYSQNGAYTLSNGEWTNLNPFNRSGLKGVQNISTVQIDPTDPTHVWGGSHGYGLIEFKNNKVQQVYDESNSVLQNIESYDHGYIRISDLEYDSRHHLWFTQSQVETPLHVITNKGDLRNINLNYNAFGDKQYIDDLAITDEDHIWFILQKPETGLLALDYGTSINTATDDREKYFEVKNQNGENFNQIFSMAKDQEGNIWVGTASGPVVYYNPEKIFSSSNVKGEQIKIPRNDETNFADYLLGTASIKAIAIDGANRKWFGTQSSGVYLISEDGKEQIHHFTEENSPLFSNTILDITINQNNGEVFFATNKGMLSYRSDASEGKEQFNDIYVFPNPVKKDYSGLITIKGLVENTHVKITDISGNLVYQTQANGGMLTWDGTNMHGSEIQSGVYLVFCTNEDGSETKVTKLLFMGQ